MAEPNGSDDDRYVLEDDGASVEDIEHEMQKAADEAIGEAIGEAAGDGAPPSAPLAQADGGMA